MLSDTLDSPRTPFLPKLTQWLVGVWHQLILFALPLLITLINPNWIYNPPVLNNVDTWIYTGLFRYFFDFADKHPSNWHYFIERLSWVLPGYAAYHIFSPEVANAVLHLGVYFLTVFALYGVARRLFGKDAALLMALCLGSYTWFLRAVGHDYIDGIGIAYFSAALWFATQAAYQPRYKGYLFGCGVFLGASLVTQLFLAMFIPIIGIYYLALNWKNHQRSLIISIAWVGGGAAILILGIMLFNLLTVGEVNIFANSLTFIRNNTESMQLRVFIIRDYGATPMTWMALPCLLSLCFLVYLARWKHVAVELRFALRLVMVVFSLTLGGLIVLHFKTSYPFLILYLYMSLMIPALFLLLAGLIAMAAPKLDMRQGFILLAVILLPFILSITLPTLEAALLDVRVVWAFAGAAMLVLALALLRIHKPLWIVGSFAVMSLMFSGHNGIAYYDRLYTYNIFMATSNALETIDAQDPGTLDFSPYVVWEAGDEFFRYSMPLRGMSQPVYGHASKWEIAHTNARALKAMLKIVQDVLILSADENVLTEANDLLSDHFDVKVNHNFALPSADPTGRYRGYLLTLTRLDHYGESVFPFGDNVNWATQFAPTVVIGWTGPGADVVLKFNLPAPEGDVVVEVCAITSTIALADELPALVNQIPITFTRQPASGETCLLRYTADVPQAAITGDEFTEIALNIPVAPADTVLHNGVKDLYGMGITTITFYTADIP